MLKAEEKASLKLFGQAKEELLSKFSKLDPLCFGNIKFLICFAVAKNMIRFYAIDGPSRSLVNLTNDLYIDRREDRVQILKTVINITRILRTVVENDALPTQVLPLGKPMEEGNSTITVFEDVVVKEVSSENLPLFSDDDVESRVDFLRMIYNHAKGQHGLVQIDESDRHEPITYKVARNRPGKYKVRMKTRGYRRMPTTEDDVRMMTKSLLAGLSRLHSGRYVHCDIRPPNVLYDPNVPEGCNYVLIDFEHGRPNGQVFEYHLRGWDDKTLEDDNTYTTRSDMYQLGKMLRSFGLVKSEAGKDFIKRLMEKNMPAEKALDHKWIVI
jgi:serine/threonine protein kinase